MLDFLAASPSEYWALAMFGVTFILLLTGYPVALVLGGNALLFAFIASMVEPSLIRWFPIRAYPDRVFGIIENQVFLAIPPFIFMGIMLEKSSLAKNMLETMGKAFGHRPGGLGLSIIIVGMLLAASTGIAGSTVVVMGLISLPTMIKAGYDKRLATGLITASGTLGQIIPPSIVLIVLASQISAVMQANPTGLIPITSKDLFAAAFIPSFILVGLYVIYLVYKSIRSPQSCPPLLQKGEKVGIGEFLMAVLIPLSLIIIVLGSMFLGIASPTESASFGAVGALILAFINGRIHKNFSLKTLLQVSHESVRITTMVFTILIGAALFNLVFRGFGGDKVIEEFLTNLPGGKYAALFVIMLFIFFLGFFLDVMEIIFVIIPLVTPAILSLGIDPLWFGILVGINLQTSFLTPPFGFALFFLAGVAPKEIQTADIYKGAIPFVIIQIIMMIILFAVPNIVHWHEYIFPS
ncbi:MAG: TRAP transporter large permease subunit [Alphaproteobacteria bacterium]